MGTLELGRIAVATTRVVITYGRRVWTARVDLAEELTLTTGTAVTLRVDESVWPAVVLRGGSFLSRSSYVLCGGGGAWRLPLALPALRSDGGVRLATAVDHLATNLATTAAASGGLARPETVELTGDRRLGRAWAPIRSTAAALLDELVDGAWYVTAAGVTRVQAVSTVVLDATRYGVEEHEPEDPRTLLAPREPADLAAAIAAIGGTLVGDPLPVPIPIRELRITEASVLRIEVR